MLTCGLRMRYRFAVTTFSWTSIRTPSPIPRLNRRLTPPGTCAMRLTPGTLSAESRAMVTSTSGETVVFPCEYDSVIVSPYSGGRVERRRIVSRPLVHQITPGLDTPANTATRPARTLHHRHPAVHAEDLTGNKRGWVRSEKSDGVGNFFRRALARQRDHLEHGGEGLRIHQLQDLCVDKAWRHSIDGDITRRDLACQRLGESDLPAFGR